MGCIEYCIKEGKPLQWWYTITVGQRTVYNTQDTISTRHKFEIGQVVNNVGGTSSDDEKVFPVKITQILWRKTRSSKSKWKYGYKTIPTDGGKAKNGVVVECLVSEQ